MDSSDPKALRQMDDQARRIRRLEAGRYVTSTSVIAGGTALTRTDDTNVTVTLGGAPTTALLTAASLTMGWTGTLAVARGGTGAATAGDARTNLGLTAGGAGDIWVEKAGDTMTGTLIVPTVAGGAAADSTLILESTTGAGTTDAIIFKTGSQVEAARIGTGGNLSLGVGSSLVTGYGVLVNGTVTSTTTGAGVYVGPTITNTSHTAGVSTILLQRISSATVDFTSAGVTTGAVYGLLVEPSTYTVTASGGGTITLTAGLRVSGAMTAGTTNYGLWLAASTATARMDGDVMIGSHVSLTPLSTISASSTTGAVLTLARNDTGVAANDMVGKIQFHANDTSSTTQNIVADIEAQATNTIATDINPGRLIFRTTSTTVAATPTERVRISEDGNVGINVTAWGTSAAGALGLGNGTVPGSSPADMIQIFSVDASAGNATLGLRTEAAVVTEAVTSDRTLQIVVNGTVYKVLLKA